MIDKLLVRMLNALVSQRPRSTDGLLLGHAVEPPHNATYLPQARRFEHAVIVGKTGVGKTHCLEHIANRHFENGEGFCFFDFHGDATEHLVALAAGHEKAPERLIVIDPTDPDRCPGLNPLEITHGGEVAGFSRSAELAAILKQRWGMDSLGARTEELTRNTLFTLSVNGYTLVEAPLLLTSRVFRSRLVSRISTPEVLSYWLERYEPLSDAMKAVFREPLLNKISAFVTDPLSRHLIGQQRSTVNFADAMRAGHWILINLSKGKLRDHAHTLGNLIFARLQFDVMARSELPEGERRLFGIICDEVQNIAENDLVVLLAEGRKYGCQLISANQYWDQLPTELRGALLSAGTHIFFRISAHDASTLAAELSAHGRNRFVQQLTSLPRGEAIVRVGWDPPVTVRIPPLPKRPPANVIARLHRHASNSHSRDRNLIEAEIRARRSEGSGEPPAIVNGAHPNDQSADGQTDW